MLRVKTRMQNNLTPVGLLVGLLDTFPDIFR